MSKNRDIPTDHARTRLVMKGGSQFDPDDVRKNWLGHRIGSKADTIDRMLAGGIKKELLMKARETNDAVEGHLSDLENEHRLGYKTRADGLTYLIILPLHK